MKKFEYFISYFYVKPDGNIGFGSNTLFSNEDLDDLSLSDIVGLVMNESGRLGSELTTAIPLFYHKRKTLEE